MRENRPYGSVGGWGLASPPPTQSMVRRSLGLGASDAVGDKTAGVVSDGLNVFADS